MGVYIRKPIVLVYAVQWRGDNIDEVMDFVSNDISVTKLGDDLIIPVFNKSSKALIKPGDFILREKNGTYTPYKVEEFSAMYEPYDNNLFADKKILIEEW